LETFWWKGCERPACVWRRQYFNQIKIIQSWQPGLESSSISPCIAYFSVPQKKSARMSARPFRVSLLGFLFLTLVIASQASSEGPTSAKPYFEENLGQTDSQVTFLQHGPDYILFFTRTGTVLKLQRGQGSGAMQEAVLRMSWENANAESISGADLQTGKVNYLDLRNTQNSLTGIRTFGKIEYKNLYPKIDLLHYSNQGELEHDLRVAPGADPSMIVLHFEGADSLTLAADGTLTAKVGLFQVHQSQPVAYQEISGHRQPVEARYALLDKSRIGFKLGTYDHRYALVIDPVLRYSTFIGGTNSVDFNGNPAPAGTTVAGMAVDAKGDVYIGGTTTATDFPTTTGAFNRSPGFDCERGAPACASSSGFMTKLNASGSVLVYSTYINTASNGVGINALAIDGAGNAYFTSTDGCSDCSETPIVVDKLNAAGSALIYSFFFGGSCGFGFSMGNAIAVNAAGEAYVAGHTSDGCLPTTSAAFQPTFNGNGDAGFIVRVNAAGTAALDATYLGSNSSGTESSEERITDLKLDTSGNVYVTGVTSSPSRFPHSASFGQGLTDQFGNVDAGFVSKFGPTLSGLAFSTVLGGAQPGGIALDSAREPFMTGGTRSVGFPVTPGAFQTTLRPGNCPIAGSSFPCTHGFVTKLNATGSALVYSTFLEGSTSDAGTSIGVDSGGNAHVTGVTNSADFPVTSSAFQKTYPGGTCFGGPCNSGFVTMVLPTGKGLFFSSYLGGQGDDEPVKIFVDPAWNSFVAGGTTSKGFPTTAGVFQKTFSGAADGFVSKVIIEADLRISNAAVTTIKRGTNLTYSIHAANPGPDPAFKVFVKDTIPAGTTFVSATTNLGTCTKPAVGATGTVSCTQGTLNAASQMSVAITVHVNAVAGSILKDTSTVSSITQDLNSTNNSSTVSTKVF
jgi:uncharacterized repeat protein (TIGR01451 family)